MEESLSLERRQFLKKVAAGTISATVLLVYRQYANAEENTLPGSAIVLGSPAANGSDTERDLAYVIQIDKCIGSGDCVRACSAENDVPAGMFRTWVERFIKTDEGIYVDSPNGGFDGFPKLDEKIAEAATEAWYVPKMCNQCHEPPCVPVCPVGATFQTEEGFVLMDNEHCIGCSYCIQGCPYSARFLNPKTNVADKCDWCYHRVQRGEKPACVEACPTGARLFGDLNDKESEISKVFHEKKWMVLKPEKETDSYCFYVGLPEEVV